MATATGPAPTGMVATTVLIVVSTTDTESESSLVT
jgi:hypothetical protein